MRLGGGVFFIRSSSSLFVCVYSPLLPDSSEGTFSTRRQQHPPLLVCVPKIPHSLHSTLVVVISPPVVPFVPSSVPGSHSFPSSQLHYIRTSFSTLSYYYSIHTRFFPVDISSHHDPHLSSLLGLSASQMNRALSFLSSLAQFGMLKPTML